MKALSSLLLTGLVHEGDIKFVPPSLPHLGSKRLLKRVGLPALLLAALLAASGRVSLEGKWLDQSFSEHFSAKYGCPVHFKDVKITGWFDISLRSLAIRSREGKLLISATSGTVDLKKFGVRKDLLFEADLRLANVAFEKEYYKNSPYFNKTFGYFMHKPLIVKDLTVNVAQDERHTRIRIVRCASKDVSVDGHMILENARVVQDKLLVTFSPFMMVRAVLPKDRADLHP
ncbi:MAG: hypothetical protein ACREH5_01625 [Candidatus Omnitrophota bacterium]